MVDPMMHKTMLKVGDNAYEVDLNKDSHQQQDARGSVSAATKVGVSSSPTKALAPATSASAPHH